MVNCSFDPGRVPRLQPVYTPDVIHGASARRNRILEQWQEERKQAAKAVYESGLIAQVLEGRTLDDAAFIKWMDAADQLGKIQLSLNEDAQALLRSKAASNSRMP